MSKKYSKSPIVEPISEFQSENPKSAWDDKAISSSFFVELEKVYFFKEKSQVIRFLNENSYLIPLLFDTAKVIEQYFPDYKPKLRYPVDQEVIDSTRLYIDIPTKYSPKEALDKLDKFEDNWWLENEYKGKGNLTLNVEFH